MQKFTFLLLDYDWLSTKLVVQVIHRGPSVVQLDDIFKGIELKYARYEIKCQSSRKEERIEQAVSDGRHFKFLVKVRVVMVWCTIVCT
jgi:hypothetical protein